MEENPDESWDEEPQIYELEPRHVRRLQAWASFLRDIDEELWDYAVWMENGDLDPDEAFAHGGGCGTAGCAVGWLPQIFPEEFGWTGTGKSVRRNGFSTMKDFFGLSTSDWKRIEINAHQDFDIDAVHRSEVEPEDVADVIEKIIRWRTGREDV